MLGADLGRQPRQRLSAHRRRPRRRRDGDPDGPRPGRLCPADDLLSHRARRLRLGVGRLGRRRIRAAVEPAIHPRRRMTGAPTERAARIIERLDTLFEIGRGAGTNRPGLGEGEQRAHGLVAGWMHEAGLDVTVDGAGNLLGRAPGADLTAGEVWTGSHLDTPPDGGRFDGALGVVTGLDVAEAILASGGARRTIAAVAFRLEEGPRFGRGVFG